MTLRDECAPVIAQVIMDVGRDDIKALRKALRAAYSKRLGMRKYWPYKVWCSEVRKQIGRPLYNVNPPNKNINQMELFE